MNCDDLTQARAAYANGDLDTAYAHYLRVGVDTPKDGDVFNWLGEIAMQLENYDVAIKHYTKALSLLEDDFSDHGKVGLCFYENSEPEKAVFHLQKAIHDDASDDVSHANYGRALYEYYCTQHAKHAQKLAREWLENHPDNPDAKHIGTAISGAQKLTRASNEYVRDIFDCFANDFDEKLAELDYAVPWVIAGIIDQYALPAQSHILDLGCGTGLVGAAMHMQTANLVGVDISQAMLDKADLRNKYRATHCADIENYLHANKVRLSAICCADVLCYLGDLTKIMTHAKRSLLVEGIFVFSIELPTQDAAQKSSPQTAGEYLLSPSGRFQHAREYIHHTAHNSGLKILSEMPQILRTEYGKPVHGLIFVMQPSRE